MMLCMVVADPVGVHKLDGVLDYCYMEGVCTSDTEHVLLVFCQRTEGVAFVDDKAVEYEEDAATAEALDQALKDLGEMTTKHEELKEQNAELKEKHADLKDDHAELKEAQGGLTDEANSKLSSAETRLSGLRMKLEREINAREDAERDFKRAQGQVSSAWTFIWILLAGIAVLLAVSAYMTYRYQNAAKPTVVLVTSNRGDGSPSGGQQVAEEEAPTVVMGRTITNEKGADALAGNVVVP
jgi:predicted RNase H-like nuclease (RuvC/YqgF family)